MLWTLLSVASCAGLVVRLLFWTDEHRRKSRWYYRLLLFVVTIYAASNVINFIYTPTALIPSWLALFHAVLFYGAFIIRPQYLPWNGQHDIANKACRPASDTTDRLRYRVRNSGVHCQGSAAEPRKHSPDRSPRSFH